MAEKSTRRWVNKGFVNDAYFDSDIASKDGLIAIIFDLVIWSIENWIAL